MTDLKKESDEYAYQREPQPEDEPRMYHLYHEIYMAMQNYKGGKSIIPFQTPCRLRAQASFNQTGYGNIYNGEELVEEGTLYGETTDFLIIGIIVEPS